ncbi:neprilysin-1 [Trichonephila clavipes]|uniref:Neprilysin-1 n=1 Tax=Trichonephila clavipes TaxID=2585209 RepID=A0A8X6WA05_TRICX|nr:neprilysin-1 [Trichonephila clavipes]
MVLVANSWLALSSTGFAKPNAIDDSLFQIEAIGDKPLRDVVRELGGWPVSERDWEEPEWPLEHLLGQLRGDYNQGIIIEQWVGPDDKNSSVNVIQLDQMTFGLPSREYFLKDSSDRERKAYLKLMVEVAILFGAEREVAEIDMADVLELEIRLANASTPEADRHDTGAIYNKMSLQELSEIVPEFDWVFYLNTFLPTKVDDQEPVVVYALPYLQEMGQIISQANRRHDQERRTRSELASFSPSIYITSMEERLSLDIFNLYRHLLHGGSSVVPGSNS